MDLLTYDAGSATILFRPDEELIGSALVPKTPWSSQRKMDDSLSNDNTKEQKDLEKTNNDTSDENGILPRARLEYRIKISEAFSRYPYKAGENPNIRWQPMRTW